MIPVLLTHPLDNEPSLITPHNPVRTGQNNPFPAEIGMTRSAHAECAGLITIVTFATLHIQQNIALIAHQMQLKMYNLKAHNDYSL